MNKFFTIFLSIVFALVLPLVVKADCGWFSNTTCDKVRNSRSYCGPASDNSFCSGQTPCCCCDETLKGCCEKTNKATGAKTSIDSTIAKCYDNANTSWAKVDWYEGQIAYNNHCAYVINGKSCKWLKSTGTATTCTGDGYTLLASVKTCQDFGLPDPVPFAVDNVCCCRDITAGTPTTDVKGCCEIRETDSVKLIETVEVISRSQCEAKQKLPPYGQTGTTISIRFFANLVPDATGKKCVQSSTTDSGQSTTDNGQSTTDSGKSTTDSGKASKEVKFDYSGMTNPLRTINPSEVAGRVIKAVLAIIGSIFLMMIIYGGFIWMTAAGNDSKVQTGRNVLVWAIIGIIVIFLAWMLVSVIFESLAV